MKKWIALLLAVVMCLSLAACGNTEGSRENSEETETPIELSVDEKLLLGDWKAYAVISGSTSARYLSGDFQTAIRHKLERGACPAPFLSISLGYSPVTIKFLSFFLFYI